MLTLERLKEVLYYHPESGDFVWIALTGATTNIEVGTQAGTLGPQGYITIQVNGRLYRAHRLARFYVEGVWPTHMVDHKDTVKHHNWWSNIRHATRSQNGFNRRLYRNSKSKLKNIHWCERDQRYLVQIRIDGVQKCVGRFKTVDEAVAKRDAIVPNAYGEFARLS